MAKKQLLMEHLGKLILELGLKAGDRLPAERTLAEMLEVSRNTLRGILHTLEARGLVKIRPGSGCFLRTRITSSYGNPLDVHRPPEKVIADQLEAAYLVLPRVAAIAAQRISERQIDELQRCSVDLSRSIFQEHSEKVWNESLTFFHLVAAATGNDFLVRAVEQICSSDMAPYDHFFALERKDREAVFADHVKLLNALRARDEDWAGQIAEQYILRLCTILESGPDGALSDLMYRTLSDRRELESGRNG
ncbi:MAG: GntR family transcriptional regulator [Proteobacteria bacterium]|nr:GntR family transcriptional regulator [Pseudomonadota bacterium]